MGDTVIQVENVSKLYRLGEVGTGSLAHDVNRWWHRVRGKEDPYRKLGEENDRTEKGDSDYAWALRGVSFEVKKGEVLGIIGRNGAGKSTLLKILSRITTQTEGRIRVKGRIASLLEVGTGFHPELTGRENIFLNGAILGMRKAEIARKFDEIVEFSGCARYIDTPVKRYSSGMSVRLAFAVAAHLEPEILIVDEVLAVGDMDFQRKCIGKMQQVSAKDGRTVLFVSHNMQAVQNLCSRALLLEAGSIKCDDESQKTLSIYLQEKQILGSAWKTIDLDPKKDLQFTALQVHVVGSQPRLTLRIETSLKSMRKHRSAFVAFDVLDQYGNAIMQAIPDSCGFLNSENSSHELEVEINLPPLIPGHYGITAWVGPHNIETYDHLQNCVCFDVEHSPLADRTFPHHADHGYIATSGTIKYLK